MAKTLEIGANYGQIFGIQPERGSIVYMGGISFKLTNSKGQERIEESQKTYDNAMAYINQPSIHMGAF
jgi:hypothetical protein